jgi:hypothetical protein
VILQIYLEAGTCSGMYVQRKVHVRVPGVIMSKVFCNMVLDEMARLATSISSSMISNTGNYIAKNKEYPIQ